MPEVDSPKTARVSPSESSYTQGLQRFGKWEDYDQYVTCAVSCSDFLFSSKNFWKFSGIKEIGDKGFRVFKNARSQLSKLCVADGWSIDSQGLSQFRIFIADELGG